MNKKISFKRPARPASPEADDWVKAGGDDDENGSPPKKAAAAKPAPRKRKAAAPRPKEKPEPAASPAPVMRAPAPSPMTAATVPSEVRWLDRTLDSVDRQLETISARVVARLGQAGKANADLLREIDRKADRTIKRLENLKKSLRGG